MKAIFYLPNGARNSITDYHFAMLEEVFKKNNVEIRSTDELIEIENHIVVTGRSKHFFDFRRKNPNNYFIHRFAGVTEEVNLLFKKHSFIRRFLFSKYSQFLERFALKHNHFRIVMSDKMKKHFISKYKVKDYSFFEIPCFNSELSKHIKVKRYTQPSFVYVGSLAEWQCPNETLKLFSEIQKSIPTASITFLTKQVEEAENLFKVHKVTNAKAYFVEINQLNEELKKFKYGFLIRENHIVNNVATPTKMNNYLSNYIIPIYTNVISSFEKNISLNDNYGIKLQYNDPFKHQSDIIIKHHKNTTLNFEEHRKVLNALFNAYYNREKYLIHLESELKKQKAI